ncbi:hypothetical protein A0257_21245 [Hymenobacter psoromatis]|nr:hypothetical protein A0257_21245 [Hymenobacter psoromatis]
MLETKQGTDTPDQAVKAAKAELGQSAEKRRKGHPVRGTAKWEQMMRAAQEQAIRYVRALPSTELRRPFVVVMDVAYCFDLCSNFAGVGNFYVPYPNADTYRFLLPALNQPNVQATLHQLFTAPHAVPPVGAHPKSGLRAGPILVAGAC